jgi:hypothetical protein
MMMEPDLPLPYGKIFYDIDISNDRKMAGSLAEISGSRR